MSETAKENRVLVWDVKGQYSQRLNYEIVDNHNDLVPRLKNAKGKARISYRPRDLKDFDYFCRCAFNWSRQQPAVIICEELADSTNSNKATGHWGRLVNQSLEYGTQIYGLVQRGQEADKSILSNANIVNVCRPRLLRDAIYIANELGLDLSEIPDVDKEMLAVGIDRSKVKRRLYFRNNKPYLRGIKKFSKVFD
jgi:hypothetical protein